MGRYSFRNVGILLLFVLSTSSVLEAQQPFLSNLSATRDSPLFTTYAAAMERSEFTLDEGFHFVFYDPDKGLDFITDTAGDWCLAFKRGDTYVYLLKEMFQEPVIHASYADIVTYTFQPFRDIRVDVTFLVYSSRMAIQDIEISNMGDESVEITVIPFLRNDYRTFDNVRFHHQRNGVTCIHEELPDGWVLDHDIPFVDKVHDVFMLSEPPDGMTSFYNYSEGAVRIPHGVEPEIRPVYVVRGRMHHADGERCHHVPRPRLKVILNGDKNRILTDTAPRWGSYDENVNRYAFYGIELGHFGEIKTGDDYTITVMCRRTGEMAVHTGVIEDLESKGERQDITFAPMASSLNPPMLKKELSDDGRHIRLSWNQIDPHVRYNVYRRDYETSGVYALLAREIEQTSYTDRQAGDGQIRGYLVAAVDSLGRMGMVSEEVTSLEENDFLSYIRGRVRTPCSVEDLARVIALEKSITLQPNQSRRLRVIRGFAKDDADLERVIQRTAGLVDENLKSYVHHNEKLYSRIPRITFDDPDTEMLYWSAFSLMRQVMLPPEGKCGYNYYVFSREPTWGWGHGGQVFHESLTMLAYAHMDSVSAMNSQHVYLERQYDDGYINYRTGPYLDETIETHGEVTSSAPWYAWQNWEVYKITKDTAFLRDMYASSKRFYQYYVARRDKDGDGLCEWGGHAVLESVRDAWVAVWDEVAWPTHLEGVDLNAMLVKEARALADMAGTLGLSDEAEAWTRRAQTRVDKINEAMWDEECGFYFHVDKKDNDFTYHESDDLKREEIIGFLPMWAGVASREQAAALVQKLTDPHKFWRPYGIPTLAADDPYYNPKGYWNGPVWVEWNALIVDGLIQYGYTEQAEELVQRVASNMIAQLKKYHDFYEFYSPDHSWAGYHKTYIWAGMIARMLMDVNMF